LWWLVRNGDSDRAGGFAVSKFQYFLFILGSFILLYGAGRAWKLKPESKYDHILLKGETAVLTIQGSDAVWLAFNKDDCYSMNVAMAHKDSAHLRGCEDAATAFAVPAGTFVKVIGASVSRKHVQVLDGPLAGKSGWVEFQYLRPRRPGEFQ
jgi:hypothetical protein